MARNRRRRRSRGRSNFRRGMGRVRSGPKANSRQLNQLVGDRL